MAQKKKRRHYEPRELMEELKHIACEKRIAERSPVTAAGIICGYGLYKSENVTQSQLAKVVQRVNEYEEQYQNGELEIKTLTDELDRVAKMKVDFGRYEDSDLKKCNGDFNYWINQIQMDAMNTINEVASRYMVMFYVACHDCLGYGEKRINRVSDTIHKYLTEYTEERGVLRGWVKEMYDKLGVYYEEPIDPLTGKKGSILTGND